RAIQHRARCTYLTVYHIAATLQPRVHWLAFPREHAARISTWSSARHTRIIERFSAHSARARSRLEWTKRQRHGEVGAAVRGRPGTELPLQCLYALGQPPQSAPAAGSRLSNLKCW